MKNSPKIFVVSVPALRISFLCRSDEYLLTAMRRSGLFKGGGCGGGGCGICKVRIVSGEVSCGTMSREHITRAEEEAGFVLACRAKLHSNLILDSLNTL